MSHRSWPSGLVRRAKLLAWLGVGWHGIEAAVAVGAGLAAGSIALIGFGADSLIESAAGILLLWRFAASEEAERRAQQLIALSFYVLAAYVGFEAIRNLLTGERPDASWVGIGLAAVTLATMPPLAIAKARVGEKLGSSATKSEGQQNMLCAYLSAALLVGLGANALFGLWWAGSAGDLFHGSVYLRPKTYWRSARRMLRYATIRGEAGEQEAQSLGSKRNVHSRRAGSSGGSSRRAYVVIALIAAVFLAGFAALVIVDARQKAASRPPGDVQTYDVGPPGQHSEGDVDYAQTPPVGGEHNPVWQNCGFYEEPVRDETAVHSLEHGAVWITYDPDLPQDEVERLRDLAQSNGYVLVSPYSDLDFPVVASAWGKQLNLESAEDPDLERFINTYSQGPQTPEPGATCTGGVGDPA